MHLTKHAHGKSRVRVARVWREGAVHHAVEWQCEVLLESDMAPAYLRGDNSDMTATDTIKNTVRSAASHAALHPTKAPAKLCTPCRCITWRSSSASAAPRSSSAWRLQSTSWRSTPRRGRGPLRPGVKCACLPGASRSRRAACRAEQVSAADVTIEQKPWARTTVAGQPHDHGTHTPVLPAHRCGRRARRVFCLCLTP